MRNPGQKRSILVVGGVMGVAASAALYFLLPAPWFLACLGLLVYEGTTLIDSYGNNTISEAVWILARRPLIPLMAGVALGWALAAGVLSGAVSFGLGLLTGHFFWQAQKVYNAADAE